MKKFIIVLLMILIVVFVFCWYKIICENWGIFGYKYVIEILDGLNVILGCVDLGYYVCRKFGGI